MDNVLPTNVDAGLRSSVRNEAGQYAIARSAYPLSQHVLRRRRQCLTFCRMHAADPVGESRYILIKTVLFGRLFQSVEMGSTEPMDTETVIQSLKRIAGHQDQQAFVAMFEY